MPLSSYFYKERYNYVPTTRRTKEPKDRQTGENQKRKIIIKKKKRKAERQQGRVIFRLIEGEIKLSQLCFEFQPLHPNPIHLHQIP